MRFNIKKYIKQEEKKYRRNTCPECSGPMIESKMNNIKLSTRVELIKKKKPVWFRDVTIYVCQRCGYVKSTIKDKEKN